MNRIYVTTAAYILGRSLGIAEANRVFHEQIANPTAKSLPVVHTINRFREMAEVGFYVDFSASLIGMMRSRAFHLARVACAYDDFQAWISLDDDIEISTETASMLLDVLDDIVPRVVFLPYPLRPNKDGDAHLSVNFPAVRHERTFRGARLLTMPHGWGGGFGCVGVNAAAMRDIVAACPDDLRWVDEDKEEKCALFHAIVAGGVWFGEDVSFFQRVPSSVSVEALVSGLVAHAGLELDLSTL